MEDEHKKLTDRRLAKDIERQGTLLEEYEKFTEKQIEQYKDWLNAARDLKCWDTANKYALLINNVRMQRRHYIIRLRYRYNGMLRESKRRKDQALLRDYSLRVPPMERARKRASYLAQLSMEAERELMHFLSSNCPTMMWLSDASTESE
jgi:hypothetical protein